MTRALVVGVDAYEQAPLTTAVNDAVAFRDAVCALGLAAPEDTTLLTSPIVAEAEGEAGFKEITTILKDLYFNGDDIERVIVYFAGHGLLAFSDPAHTQASTAILPHDVRDVESDARDLIHLDELLRYFRRAGPKEQLFFIDACRDIPYTKHPGHSSLGWGNRTPGHERCQAVLYAVAELGQASAIPGAHGVMTRRLIEALEGAGRAVDYSLDDDAYVITMPSVRNYLRVRVKEDIGGAGGDLSFALPSLDAPDPPPAPIRVVAPPRPRALTVHIEPDEKADTAKVQIGLGGSVVVESWPPSVNHSAVTLDPRPHRMTATATGGLAEPATCVVDVREQTEAVVRIRAPGDEEPPGPRVQALPGRAMPHGPTRGGPGDLEDARPEEAGNGTLRVAARDNAVGIDVAGLEPPYVTRSALGSLEADVPPGSYRVAFRFGPEPLSATQAYVAAGEIVAVAAPQDVDFARRTAGPVLSATDWQLLGLAPFMQEDMGAFAEKLRGLRGYARRLSRPVAVVVEPDVERVFVGTEDAWTHPVETPRGVVAIAIAEGPSASFDIALPDPRGGAVAIASATLTDRVTVLTRRRTSDGRLDITQNLFPHPARPRLRHDPAPELPEMARLLQVGQQLYKSGELLRAERSRDVRKLLYGKWTDPILGCMGVYAAAADVVDQETERPLSQAAFNLVRFFGDLPDARIAAAVLRPDDRYGLLAPILEHDAVPLLAHSAALLAQFAITLEARDHPAVERHAEIPAGQVWNLRRLRG